MVGVGGGGLTSVCSRCLAELSVLQSAFRGGKVLSPRTITTRSAKRGQTEMKATRDYFSLLLVLLAAMTDMGAKGKNCQNNYFGFFSL